MIIKKKIIKSEDIKYILTFSWRVLNWSKAQPHNLRWHEKYLYVWIENLGVSNQMRVTLHLLLDLWKKTLQIGEVWDLQVFSFQMNIHFFYDFDCYIFFFPFLFTISMFNVVLRRPSSSFFFIPILTHPKLQYFTHFFYFKIFLFFDFIRTKLRF